ncbi:hypothetical protein N7462_007490 [Penicillium macrosclerotiorum]|uniref:uncharacterized protein n=1 Tax=Penicillium macrosclerotiorum TaxID=303699 RepID=UPI0025468CDE|nr:uncharacterized protein N7462_007490 [Penicillium macrosclerotiorum]KAJ5679246.1 hypothetical protein N7462_007490 [Penicillium macrosclerotiorum]
MSYQQYPPPNQPPYGSQQPPPHGYPQQQSYPPQQGGYPPQQGAYPPQQGAYPPQHAGYPPQHQQYGPGGLIPPQGHLPASAEPSIWDLLVHPRRILDMHPPRNIRHTDSLPRATHLTDNLALDTLKALASARLAQHLAH